MLPHHEQVVEMARLAADRAEAAQAPEMETLSGWSEAWGAPAGTDHGSGDHGGGHGGMDGMMSEEEMSSLSDASGGDFDRMFLEMMLEHHRGAVAMAEVEIAEGRTPTPSPWPRRSGTPGRPRSRRWSNCWPSSAGERCPRRDGTCRSAAGGTPTRAGCAR